MEFYKEKIINRIKKENLLYFERFNLSLQNNYQYLYKVGNTKDKCIDGISISAPRFTDDSDIEQAYCLAHELGHHNINKKLRPIVLRLSRNVFLKILFEKKAWKEAEKICISEEIPILKEFDLIKSRCLDTYREAIKDTFRNSFHFILKLVVLYYKILITFYFIYKISNENIIDLFGIVRFFNGISIETVYQITNSTWYIYIVYSIIKYLIKNMKLLRSSLIMKIEGEII